MRVKNRDLILLNDIYECLMMHKEVKEAQGLDELLSRLEAERKNEREKNRKRAAENRANLYAWSSSYHPRKSKYAKTEANESIDVDMEE